MMPRLLILQPPSSSTPTSTPPNNTPLTLSPDPTPHPNLGVEDKVKSDHGPTLVVREGVVEVACELLESWKTSPGDGGEVVVFVVVSDLLSFISFWH